MVGLYLGTDDPLVVADVAGAGQLWACSAVSEDCREEFMSSATP